MSARTILITLCLATTAGAGVTSACSAESETAIAQSPIIGGTDAPDPALNAIGALGWESGIFCTATLIAPQVVLTARHCALREPNNPQSSTMLDKGGHLLLIGPDSNQAIRKVRATAITTSSIFSGGVTSHGSDVALYTLAVPITDITPLQVASAPPSAADEGTVFTAMGYGVQNADGGYGTRRSGAVTLRAVSGAPNHLLFSSTDELAAAYGRYPPFTPGQQAEITAHYDQPVLLDYEAFVGAAPNDVQICHGDSGGPLLRRVDGKLVVFGVASTATAEEGLLCTNGGVYAVFGASTRQIIASAIGESCWPDANGVVRCSASSEPHACSLGQPADGGALKSTPFYQACLASRCCVETSACVRDPECWSVERCFQNCLRATPDASDAGDAGANPTACIQACFRSRPGVMGKYLGYANCARQACEAGGASLGDAGVP